MSSLFSPDQVVDAYIKATSVENNAEPNYNLSETRNVTSTIPGGTVNIAEISITVRSGERITLAGQYSSLSINEDIFASCISGSITIIDTAGFLESFRIKGGEQINIKITKPYTNDIIIWREDLIVHKISEYVTFVQNQESQMCEFEKKKPIRGSPKQSRAQARLATYEQSSKPLAALLAFP
jgi:hypothetical protein